MIQIEELAAIEAKIGEPLCIAFANTLGWRGDPNPQESIESPGALKTWLDRVGVASVRSLTSQDLAAFIELREAIYRTLSAHSAGNDPQKRDLEVIRQGAVQTLGDLTLVSSIDGPYAWSVALLPAVARAYGLIALSAAALLSSIDLSRVRECANERCLWLFLDRSKNRSRKWCTMSDCGNVAKARRHYERKAKAARNG